MYKFHFELGIIYIVKIRYNPKHKVQKTSNRASCNLPVILIEEALSVMLTGTGLDSDARSLTRPCAGAA